MKGLLKLLAVMVRNQLFLKPVAWPALRSTRRSLRKRGFVPKSIELWLGLAEPSSLCLMVILPTDAELGRFQHLSLLGPLQQEFRSALVQIWYPKNAVSLAGFQVHSNESISRAGGYYAYFK